MNTDWYCQLLLKMWNNLNSQYLLNLNISITMTFQFSPKYILKRNAYICSSKQNLYNVQSSTTPNISKVATCVLDKWVSKLDKYIEAYLHNGMPYIIKIRINTLQLHTIIWTNLINIILRTRKITHNTLYYSIYKVQTHIGLSQDVRHWRVVFLGVGSDEGGYREPSGTLVAFYFFSKALVTRSFTLMICALFWVHSILK